MIYSHLTCQFWLPDIMDNGISRGELPLPPDKYRYADVQAVNLTTNPDPKTNHGIWVCDSAWDKTKIKIDVDLEPSEVVSFRQIREKYQMRENWLKVIAPYEERKHWFYFFGVIPPERFHSVQIRQGRSHVAVDVAELVSKIRAEREKNWELLVTGGGRNGARMKPGVESWLMDGFEAAEEFGSH